ncbi:Rne/Rng family ribonuclease [Roseibium denhamense]|uniref:Ribonuclease E n=1 Tax=Roseibium denhamense TaxID=76305 RepID=A0ABY1PFE6_9HYPH|nr:Rne/Rng family ribonuclease [Roseibium denhamense]MTI04996.1 Rne/Rng family ribonuclease [Roseibium denhamense]SMP33251.1 ribonuclease E [Roseibium denhamense]
MANKMLIDAGHPEETRVVVVRGNRVEEFDFEAANRKQLRGNIYLAKVTRVEPSLQAAFVEYGGNRHGFLAFSEIHPDYYQIPVADREALLAAEAAERQRDDAETEEKPKRRRRTRAARNESADAVVSEAVEPSEDGAPENQTADAETSDQADQPGEADAANDESQASGDGADTTGELSAKAPAPDGEDTSETESDNEADSDADAENDGDAETEDDSETKGSNRRRPRATRGRRRRQKSDDIDEDDLEDEDGAVESVGAEDALEELPERPAPVRKQYKIQEVIKRRQIILVQVVKEERGNKGAALTTYLSLAGRYSVLMPNTARGGGISRKITQPTDRKRLKTIASELDVPEGMGVILRTAGASRTKAEIKRDFEYLMRLWENVRELTLQSSAPSLVYEEGSLVKRSIRDLYNKDISEVLVSGDEGYREAKDFMRMLMPSHAKNVQPYRDPSPLFIRYGVEPQLDAMFSPHVTLKSGGYIVINQTEALVSIDVNSGKSTREHNIEDTALQTNLEAAEEVTRQLRLRDLAGLIVIDFIDMEESKNNRAVERKLKDCLKTDRARIQVGRISHFGLLEMSRQRIRTGVLESSTTPCPHCQGTGMIRSVESVALHVLRSIEDNLLKGATHDLIVRTTAEVALYILNIKRSNLFDLETRFAVGIEVQAGEMVNGQLYVLERGAPIDRERFPQPVAAVQPDIVDIIDEEPDQPVIEDEIQADNDDDGDGDRDRRRRRRRKRRRGGSDNQQDGDDRQAGAESAASEDSDEDQQDARSDDQEDGDDEPRRKRRRGRRGGRRGRRGGEGAEFQAEDGSEDDGAEDSDQNAASDDDGSPAETNDANAPAEAAADATDSDGTTGTGDAAPDLDDQSTDAGHVNGAETTASSNAAPQNGAADETSVAEEVSADSSEAESRAGSTDADQPAADEEPAEPQKPSAPAEPVVTSETATGASEDKPKRGGWWQRGRSFF